MRIEDREARGWRGGSSARGWSDTMPGMSDGATVAKFIAKWSRTNLTERAASQEHFIDLCRLLGQPTPAEHDATGAEYTFEKGVTVTGPASRGTRGERGFADVWWRGKFGWEYKRKDKYKDLAEAYRQLCQYREALENPPLLIVSDIARIEIHTNFTGTRKEVHVIELDSLGHPDNLAKLRRVFTDPQSFKPTLTTSHLTETAAAEFAKIADQLRQRGHDPHEAAHFLMKCMFCLFAEDVNLLPKDLFSKLLATGAKDPQRLTERLNGLFAAMRQGGDFGVEEIKHFNGGLFDEAAALPLKGPDIQAMRNAGEFDWGAVEPSIFGTLFERSLDPDKRSQIGAHYTSRQDVMLIVEPVVMAPLRREWTAVQEKVDEQLGRRRKAKTPATRKKADEAIYKAIESFADRLGSVQVLDPACGSGNFLYVAIQELLALEKEVIVYASQPHIGLPMIPRVRPTQLHGIEINPYAAELAQVVIWIGYLQWMRDNGFIPPSDPILSALTSIECRDAILKWQTAEGTALAGWQEEAVCTGPADWPQADFIIGNPPFLGSRKARMGLGDEYVDAYQSAFPKVPEGADLCCYWFELARKAIEISPAARSGLLATQGIRGGSSREVLKLMKKTGHIFFAESDREWVLEGAAVRISMVGFTGNTDEEAVLDGEAVADINSNLTRGVDLTKAGRLGENDSLGFQGTINSGPFDISWQETRKMLAAPNPVDAANADVLRPWSNGRDTTTRSRGQWIVDFGTDTPEHKAATYEMPFRYVKEHVRPQRDELRDGKQKYAHSSKYPFWQLWNTRHEMRAKLAPLTRFSGTPRVTKHRLFIWFIGSLLPDAQIIAFARSDDYFFGVLHSAIHELWSRRMGTQLREAESGFRYTPTTCFETFRCRGRRGRSRWERSCTRGSVRRHRS